MDSDIVLIHVRFGSDGSVVEISERPAPLSPQQWFNLLSDGALDQYQALAGGRGIFRISRGKVEALRAEASASNAA
jgi:hypothetical protein